MTTCTERELLERLLSIPQTATSPKDAQEKLLALHDEARAFLADTPACDAEKAVLVDLFQLGLFQLHSGGQATWKIDCDALSDGSHTALAGIMADSVGRFGSVEGVPSGGVRLAKALEIHARDGPLLIVDDVLTTGASMEQQRAGREAIGAVVFARGECPPWVTPLFALAGSSPAAAALLAQGERRETALKGICEFAGRAAGGDLQGLDPPTAWLTVSENAARALAPGEAE